jgi:hypothetical protein
MLSRLCRVQITESASMTAQHACRLDPHLPAVIFTDLLDAGFFAPASGSFQMMSPRAQRLSANNLTQATLFLRCEKRRV